MAKFRFKMENILQVKGKLEEQAKAEYGMEIARLHEEEEKEAALKLRRSILENRLKEALSSILDMMEIRRMERGIDALEDMIEAQHEAVLRQARRVDLAREKLDESMKERKTYEKP